MGKKAQNAVASVPVSHADAPHLTVEELAERERTTPATVRYWVHTKTAPRSFRAGRRRLFPLAEVIAWEQAQMAADDDSALAQAG